MSYVFRPPQECFRCCAENQPPRVTSKPQKSQNSPLRPPQGWSGYGSVWRRATEIPGKVLLPRHNQHKNCFGTGNSRGCPNSLEFSMAKSAYRLSVNSSLIGLTRNCTAFALSVSSLYVCTASARLPAHSKSPRNLAMRRFVGKGVGPCTHLAHLAVAPHRGRGTPKLACKKDVFFQVKKSKHGSKREADLDTTPTNSKKLKKKVGEPTPCSQCYNACPRGRLYQQKTYDIYFRAGKPMITHTIDASNRVGINIVPFLSTNASDTKHTLSCIPMFRRRRRGPEQ